MVRTFCYAYSPCAEDPPSLPVRVTPRYVVLDTSTDLVLEARFRGNYYAHDWFTNQDDPTFNTGRYSLFSSANRTNVGQTYTISAGTDVHRVGYYGPYIIPTVVSTLLPTPENTVIVGSFGKYVHCKLTPHSSNSLVSNQNTGCNSMQYQTLNELDAFAGPSGVLV